MSPSRSKINPDLASAMEAVANLCAGALTDFDSLATSEGMEAHFEIERRPLFSEKSAAFYRSFFQLRIRLVSLLAGTYRRYFKIALAHPSHTGGDPTTWAWSQLLPAVHAALEWMRDWYILACDGESPRLRHIATLEYNPGKTVTAPIPTSSPPFPEPTTWRAPAWLFGVSLAFFGISMMKPHHVPNDDSGERLEAAHTRLLLKGAKKVFLWDLAAAVGKVRNEELAAAGAVPARAVQGNTEGEDKQKGSKRFKGIEGLGPKKTDLSQYMQGLTEKQQLAFSLKFEYGLGLAEIGSRMEVDRKTAYEHIEAAKRRIAQVRSSEKSKVHRAKSEDE